MKRRKNIQRAMCCVPSDLPVCDEERWIYNRASYGVKKVLRGGVHHQKLWAVFLLPRMKKKVFREWTLIGLDVYLIRFIRRKMSVGILDELESVTITDKDKSIKSKQCNKFSIEHILGLNDDEKLTEVKRLELMGFHRKGKLKFQTCTYRLNRNDES